MAAILARYSKKKAGHNFCDIILPYHILLKLKDIWFSCKISGIYVLHISLEIGFCTVSIKSRDFRLANNTKLLMKKISLCFFNDMLSSSWENEALAKGTFDSETGRFKSRTSLAVCSSFLLAYLLCGSFLSTN